ncbi:MAG: lytic murein transglycosylase [Kineosporiaceae bacterium]
MKVSWPDDVDHVDDARRAETPTPTPTPRTATGLRAGRILGVGLGVVLVVVELAWTASVGLSSPELPVNPPVAVVVDGEVPAAARSVEQPSAGRARAGRPLPTQLADWAGQLGPQVGVPAVALAAYGAAELVLADEQPGCHLSWVAVAGVGSVESDHGRSAGAVLLPDGRSQPPVVGIALDGNGVAAIGDSDGGRLDGDPVHDRAVGPMQFIPSTWRRWQADGDGDGRADPFALPDAALAAARYLCYSGAGDLRAAGPWTRAVLAYNASSEYLVEVTRRSNGYAAASVAR